MNLSNAFIDGVKTLKDGSIKITLVTRELSPSQMAEIFHNVNKEVLKIDLPEGKPENNKTESQRLRGVLYRVWEAHFKSKYETFALFYAHEMERVIDHYKKTID